MRSFGKNFDHEALQGLLQGGVDHDRDIDRYAASSRALSSSQTYTATGGLNYQPFSAMRYLRVNNIVTVWFWSEIPGRLAVVAGSPWLLLAPFPFGTIAGQSIPIGIFTVFGPQNAASAQSVQGWLESSGGSGDTRIQLIYRATAGFGARTPVDDTHPFDWDVITGGGPDASIQGSYTYEAADSFTP